jgi:hypothetical protein
MGLALKGLNSTSIAELLAAGRLVMSVESSMATTSVEVNGRVLDHLLKLSLL